MNFVNINEYKCEVSKELKKEVLGLQNISTCEQECILSSYRDENFFSISCSDRIFMLKFLKSRLFTLERVVVNGEEFILQIDGKISKKALTIRTKDKILTEEMKRAMGARLKKSLRKNE